MRELERVSVGDARTIELDQDLVASIIQREFRANLFRVDHLDHTLTETRQACQSNVSFVYKISVEASADRGVVGSNSNATHLDDRGAFQDRWRV